MNKARGNFCPLRIEVLDERDEPPPVDWEEDVPGDAVIRDMAEERFRAARAKMREVLCTRRHLRTKYLGRRYREESQSDEEEGSRERMSVCREAKEEK